MSDRIDRLRAGAGELLRLGADATWLEVSATIGGAYLLLHIAMWALFGD